MCVFIGQCRTQHFAIHVLQNTMQGCVGARTVMCYTKSYATDLPT